MTSAVPDPGRPPGAAPPYEAPPPFGPPAGTPYGAPPVATPSEPAPPEPAAPEPETGEPGGFDRLSLLIAILLATIGVMGAFVTWRIGQLGSDGEEASRAALAARRERSAAGVEAATKVQQASNDWLSYEIARRKAEALRNAGEYAEAVRWDREAAAFWGGVPNADIALDGTYDQAAHADALTAAATDGLDVFATPHLDAATAAEYRAIRLGQIGFGLAAILPLLTLAEITGRRRLSIALTAASAMGIAAGAALLMMAWA